ncbi:hypothetical protein Dimus_029709 [Dionaea muscipula]
MVLSARLKGGGGGDGGWGMGGFLLIFFPEDSSTTTSLNGKKKTIFSYLSSSTSTTSAAATITTKCARPAAPLVSNTRFTLSICAILVFFTILLFTLTSFEPTLPHHFSPSSSSSSSHRQLLLKQKQKPNSKNSPFSFSGVFNRNSNSITGPHASAAAALQGMGTLYRRGTKSTGELIVGHVADDVEERELRSFLRALHFNGLLARSDLALVFSSAPSAAAGLNRIAEEESESFLKLVQLYVESNGTVRDSVGGHGLTRYLRTEKQREAEGKTESEHKREKETIWGKGTRPTLSATWRKLSKSGEVTRTSYGSVVGFEASELDPENSLSGFLDDIPMGLRRWACYPMLLGRVKRNFKHLMLVDVKEMLVLGDPFARIRTRSSESVLLWSNPETDRGKRGTRSSVKPPDAKPLNPGIIVGGSRGVRRLAAAMLTEIVRAAMEHNGKGKNRNKNSSVAESGVVNQLVRNSHVLKNVHLVAPTETITEVSSLGRFNSVGQPSHGPLLASNYGVGGVLQRARRNFDVDFVLTREICSSQFFSLVYNDCPAVQYP